MPSFRKLTPCVSKLSTSIISFKWWGKIQTRCGKECYGVNWWGDLVDVGIISRRYLFDTTRMFIRQPTYECTATGKELSCDKIKERMREPTPEEECDRWRSKQFRLQDFRQGKGVWKITLFVSVQLCIVVTQCIHGMKFQSNLWKSIIRPMSANVDASFTAYNNN